MKKNEITGCVLTFENISRIRNAEDIIAKKNKIERLMANISTMFMVLAPDEIDGGITEALGSLGEITNSNLICIFQAGKKCQFLCTHTWYDTYAMSKKDILEDIVSWNSKWFNQKCKNSRIISDKELNALNLKEVNLDILTDGGKRSLVLVPMFNRERKANFMCLNSLYGPNELDDEIFRLLSIIGEIFISAIRRKDAVHLLLKNEEKYRRIFEEIHDVYFENDLTGNILTISPSVRQYLGYHESEMIGKLASSFYIYPYNRQGFLDAIIKNGYVNNYEAKLLKKDASVADVSINAHLVYDNSGKPSVIAGIIRDITEQKMIEEDLIEARMMAEMANRTKSEFIANMSHELRTPLNSIIGFSDFLLENTFGDLNDKQTRYLSNISSSGKHLLMLINDILDISKIEAGELKLNCEDFILKDAVEEVLTIMNPQALKKKITLEYTGQTQFEIRADKARIKQVLYNLISNAIKFTPQGGYVKISNEVDDDLVIMSVCDTGIGISQEDIGKLFHPFKQVDSFYNRQHHGTGLGLALVKKFIEMHDGTVSVESEPGKGSCFEIKIPMNQPLP